MSASELRQRYHKGGSVPDSELSASQLRARYGVQSNNCDFSTSSKANENSDAIMLAVGAFAVVVFLYFVFNYFTSM
ncbi:hypothetical protein TL16_g06961 [Triparma laevis f. inornata]|uniref:Uncharacterized protein n=2 Tax=Triparma laevis TaxID=1534972 RepID=A0A9W7FMM3_9STRA|nr:hypothetical protein TL16_g06961 [Triparma laevis f. inornata]GMI14785.1 hypothetical protein TrLO_g4338 [Triparma laevis f. longispina]